MSAVASSQNQFQQNQPLNVDNYLNTMTYQYKGSCLKLKDNTQFYSSGSPQNKVGVIMLPDYWGWNSGRIRNICDFFGDNGYFAVIPNFSSQGVIGETQSYMDSASLMDWYKSRTFDGNIKPVILSLANFMRSEGIDKICLLGFSWGGWVAVNLLASDIAEDFICAALPHPSLDVEEKYYGGSLPELMSYVKRPILLMPTKGDREDYKSFVKLLKYKVPTSSVIDYSDQNQGFLLSGNSDFESTRHAIHKCLNEIFNFFNQHVNMKPEELCRQETGQIELGEQAHYKGGKSWGQTMRETGESVGESIGNVGERIGETTKQTGEKITGSSQQTGENIKQKSREQTSHQQQGLESTSHQQQGLGSVSHQQQGQTTGSGRQQLGGRDLRKEGGI